MSSIRFDYKKRKETVKNIPDGLIKKFIVVENRDYRGRVTFHIAFKKNKRSKKSTHIIPKRYRVHSSLIEAELSIFEMISRYQKSNGSEFSFIGEISPLKKIFIVLKSIVFS